MIELPQLWLPGESERFPWDPVGRRPVDNRRYIQKWGQAKCCCADEAVCQIWEGDSRPDPIGLIIADLANDFCTECTDYNGEWEIDYETRLHTGPYGADCTDAYRSGGQVNYVLVSFWRQDATTWKLGLAARRSSGCTCGLLPFTDYFGGSMTIGTKFDTGQTYVLGNFVSQTNACSGGDETACGVSGMSASVDT